jgi:hypothetical protein
MYTPFTTFIWPKETFPIAPDINDAIACFLAPAGLVYATSFGFAFQQALSKQTHIIEKVTKDKSCRSKKASNGVVDIWSNWKCFFWPYKCSKWCIHV